MPNSSVARSATGAAGPGPAPGPPLLTVLHLQLEHDGAPAPAKTYLRLPPPLAPYFLRISIDPGTSASQTGVLFTNFPLDGSQFERSKYHQIPLPQDFSKPFEIDLPITSAGAFEYFIEHAAGDESSKRVRCRPGYFSVDPLLEIPERSSILDADYAVLPVGKGGVVGSELVNLPLDGLVIQTVIAKWMGSLEEWVPHLDLMRDRGYNMIHYTPLQKRGESGSPYSIFDQLDFADDLFAPGTSSAQKLVEIKRWLARIKKEWGMLGMMDVVLNHTANNSVWLEAHPESGYNVANSPHLESALELDNALLAFSASLADHGLPATLNTAADLDLIMGKLADSTLPSLKLYEYYVVNVEAQAYLFEHAWIAKSKGDLRGVQLEGLGDKQLAEAFAQLCLPEGWEHLAGRFGIAPDISCAVSFVSVWTGKNPGEDVTAAVKAFRSLLDIINVPRYELYNADLKAILDNTRSRIRYTRLDEDGPKHGPVTAKSPLVESLFIRLPDNATTKQHDARSLSLAANGWIWDADPLEDFASAASRTYLRRDLIVWGDCVKLRYGASPAANPWLWAHMTAYVELLAGIFDGFRLDNSHSTPIHVGEILLDAARRVNLNLYVCAELFTGSQELDLHFVCRLGINSLIREAMNANDPKDQSRLLYDYGLGSGPIGSMDRDCLTEKSTILYESHQRPCLVVPLAGSKPHAFLMDCTHDNESPLSKRTAQDALPTGALVGISASAIGSNRGFDDLYPKLLDVVSEERHYETYTDTTSSGIGAIKRLLNHLHTESALGNFGEGHFHQESDYIISHRVNPITHRGYLLVAHTAFSGNGTERGTVDPIKLYGTGVKFITGSTIKITSTVDESTATTLKGLPSTLSPLPAVVASSHTDENGAYSQIIVPDVFPPASVMVFATWMDGLPQDLDATCSEGADEAFKGLDMVDLNAMLYRSDGEEKDAVGGDGAYTVPGLDPLVYCGLQGWMTHVGPIMRANDLGHPLAAHLRAGTWALDYVSSRLEKQLERFPRLAPAAEWLKARFSLVKEHVPSFLRPKYFAMIINTAYKAARSHAIASCAPVIREGHSFTQALALTAVQMYGQVRSASLNSSKETPSLAAGLPHFESGWARTWGRDVFISLRGLFLVTGQFEAAKNHIKAFAEVLKHGLIPNLLDSGRTPRYNSRDSPWWFLQNIQDYVLMAPGGLSILSEKVQRRFPLSDEWVPFDSPEAYTATSTVGEVVQEIMQRHASGIHFREYNAGPNLDGQMSSRGFDIDIEVDWTTGLIHGGNASNCGTWMDKMGESDKAGNKGLPGTPRDGSPVEITGLLKSALRWLGDLSDRGEFGWSGVDATVNGVPRKVSYHEWNDLVQGSFEKLYYVPLHPTEDAAHSIVPSLVARRGIYKDVYGTPAENGRERADYQLRSNFPVAMTVAPELFEPVHALAALKIFQEGVVGPLGVKTLDPLDPDYRGSYDNSNDSHDRAVAKGWNYHQGPEWVWPIGYFLRAYLIFDKKVGAGKLDPQRTYHHISSTLTVHRSHIREDAWAGLPELTNEDGRPCHDSCDTQAWSGSTILDVLDDIYRDSRE